ncbi:DMT family transporter [Allopusillimonas ginsengisoli]|uniref:DMT family transporter n=1 Tax=Allopusillimonas ginsengisoli TaxID=453575 RepID=UPI0010C18062|nr:DMT family transporter [Allopusillimonas ginsengisoli]
MSHKLTPTTVLLLVIPPLLWAGNAVVGRAVHDVVPPVTLNFLRWAIALVILAPFGRVIFRKGSGLWKHRRRYALLGLLGIGLYNSMQYMALHTSTAVNVTLVGASMPVWMLVIGALVFGTRVKAWQIAGAVLSLVGVLVVLSHGEWSQLMSLRFVPGDVIQLIATIIWALYSWLLIKGHDPAEIRSNWVGVLLAQLVYGVAWSGAMAGGEWLVVPDAHITWSWGLGVALIYVAIGPAIVALRCWGAGVQRVGPTLAGFFANLSPLFAALMSVAFLGESPQFYHALAFVLIVGGIVVSSRSSA